MPSCHKLNKCMLSHYSTLYIISVTLSCAHVYQQTFIFHAFFRDTASCNGRYDSSDLERFPGFSIFISMHNPCKTHILQRTITRSHTRSFAYYLKVTFALLLGADIPHRYAPVMFFLDIHAGGICRFVFFTH